MRLNHHPNTAIDQKRARELRNNATPYEKELWIYLRSASKQKGLRFRRQQPIHPYIVDFACMEARLIIELDGLSHDMRQNYDHMRDQHLYQAGFTVLRFSNDAVKTNVAGVVETILTHAEDLLRPR